MTSSVSSSLTSSQQQPEVLQQLRSSQLQQHRSQQLQPQPHQSRPPRRVDSIELIVGVVDAESQLQNDSRFHFNSTSSSSTATNQIQPHVPTSVEQSQFILPIQTSVLRSQMRASHLQPPVANRSLSDLNSDSDVVDGDDVNNGQLANDPPDGRMGAIEVGSSPDDTGNGATSGTVDVGADSGVSGVTGSGSVNFSERINLREKHARHVADLRAYYEEEIRDLKEQLNRRALRDEMDRFFYRNIFEKCFW